jgi:hypothetical protein
MVGQKNVKDMLLHSPFSILDLLTETSSHKIVFSLLAASA